MYSNNRRSSTSIYSSGSDSDSISISSTRYSAAPSFCAPEDALVQLESYAPSKEIIAYVVDFIMDAVDHTNASKTSKDKPRTIPRLAKFTAFVTKVVARLPLTTPELLLTVAYVDRAQYRNNLKSFSSYGNERMFLGALALALRYLDSHVSIRDINWQLCTGQYSRTDVGRFELDFIQIIKCNDKFTDKELSAHSAVMLAVLETAPNEFLKYQHSWDNTSQSPLRRNKSLGNPHA
ncbi:hypothetical protein C8R41DRAFT_903916 [Lentinula lateritia]|uniref:Cyclin N-terminal domain-containing protein n=1 Tax=Lentinula lateritia TaxID=40482 RepID=A0ABQ8VCM5_9AGAR|nr:hypothetical protein C8R41DRAFT_903916 [Lentinula lateritia]